MRSVGPRADYYAMRHPGPPDVLLLIEVTDATGAYDRATKLPLYARAGIREVWIVDVRRSAVERYRRPVRVRIDRGRGDTLSPLAFPRMAARIRDIVG